MHRQLGIAALLSGITMLLALGAGSLLAAPSAAALAVTGFWWSVTRPHRAVRRPVTPADLCGGCARGCVECRERIDT